jgi:cyclopropane fatty-acyl-phospholipid synthase-like methyltransferase
VDLLIAFNYSYSVFKSRAQLRDYFRVARQSLRPDGIFVVDAFGGTDATVELEEDRKVEGFVAPDGRRVPSFTYLWEQVRFNPVNHDILCRIHFEFRDGTRMKNAFRYDWRFWTLPELQEIMCEAGFRSAEVYIEGWDHDADESNGIFRRRSQVEEMAGWVGYVLGLM